MVKARTLEEGFVNSRPDGTFLLILWPESDHAALEWTIDYVEPSVSRTTMVASTTVSTARYEGNIGSITGGFMRAVILEPGAEHHARACALYMAYTLDGPDRLPAHVPELTDWWEELVT